MKWFNTNTDKLPMHNQETLISVNGVYHIAVYDSDNKVFKSVRDQDLIFRIDQTQIYWTKF
jgi:hypothetical protein